MYQAKRIAAVVGLCLVLFSSVGVAMGAGATSVAVQPSSDSITAGNASTVDIFVESAAGGVGSLDVELSVTDGAVADVADTTVAGNPNTVQTSSGTDSVRIAATGMDTVDSGSVRIASVTLTGGSPGTSNLDLTVAAIGDESGNAYSITDEFDGELTVVSSGETTPTETPAETDSSRPDDDDSDSGSDDTSTPTPTDTPTPTPTDTPMPTATEQPTETATEQPTASQNNSTTSTVTNTPTQTASDESFEAAGSSDTLFIVGGAIAAALGGLIIYRRQ